MVNGVHMAAIAKGLLIGLLWGMAVACLMSLLALRDGDSAVVAVMMTQSVAFPASGVVRFFMGNFNIDMWPRFIWATWTLDGCIIGGVVGIVRWHRVGGRNQSSEPRDASRR